MTQFPREVSWVRIGCILGTLSVLLMYVQSGVAQDVTVDSLRQLAEESAAEINSGSVTYERKVWLKVDPWTQDVRSIADVDPASADPESATYWDINFLKFAKKDGIVLWQLHRVNLRPHLDYEEATRNKWVMNYDAMYSFDGSLVRCRLLTLPGAEGDRPLWPTFTVTNYDKKVSEVSSGPLDRIWEFGVPSLVRDTPPEASFDPILKLNRVSEKRYTVSRAFKPSASGEVDISANEFIDLGVGGKSTGKEVFNLMNMTGAYRKRSLNNETQYSDYRLVDNIWIPMRKVHKLYQFALGQDPDSDPELSWLTDVQIKHARLNIEIPLGELEVRPEPGDDIMDHTSSSNAP